jgi:hypothetical protein
VSTVARYAYVVLAVLIVFAMSVQIMLAGLGLFVEVTPRGGPSFQMHIALGWAMHLAPLLVVLAALLARAGRRHWIFALLLAVVVFLVPIVVLTRETMPVVAALHPLLAALAFGIGIMVLRNSIVALRLGSPAADGQGPMNVAR